MERLIAVLLAICLFHISSAQAASSVLEYQFGQIKRQAHMQLPDDFDKKKRYPVVIVLHATGDTAQHMETMTGFGELGRKENFITVFPEGVSTSSKKRMTWNAVTCCGRAKIRETDDVKFIDTLIDDLVKDRSVDRKRVYLVGQGNGGMMAYRYACKFPEKLAAIAVSGGQAAYRDCKKTARAVPVLQINGTKDICMPYEGGETCGACFDEIVALDVEPFSCLPAQANMNIWARQGDCAPTPVPGPAQGDVSCQSWKNCRGGTALNFCTVKGGGHSWAGVDNMPANCSPKRKTNQCQTWRKIFGSITSDIIATEFMWGYLKGNQKP